jgi:hypothetical protein
MASRGFLGAGDVYLARYNPLTAAFDELTGPFEATQFEIKPNSELKEMSSRGRSTYGQVIESVPLPQPADFTLTLAEVNREALVMALFGTSEAVNQGSGTIANEAVVLTAAKVDKWLPLTKQNFASAGFVVTDVAGTETFVLGTDYEVNYRMGWIKVLSTGSIGSTETIHVDGTYNAITGSNILGATQSQVRAKIVMDGVNFADQLPVITTVWEAVLTPDNAFDFLQDDFAEIQLTGRLKTPVGKTAPFEVQLRDVA